MTPPPSTPNSSPESDLRLQAADARAVDLLLDPTSISSASPEAAGRTQRVGAVLSLLDAMDEPRPAGDLVERTMRRIAEAPASDASLNAAAIQPAASATGNVGRQFANRPESPDGV